VNRERVFASLEENIFMFLQLAHPKLNIFKVSKTLVLNCYRETKPFPAEEKFGLTKQVRRAVLVI